jgi:hypothetical protein
MTSNARMPSRTCVPPGLPGGYMCRVSLGVLAHMRLGVTAHGVCDEGTWRLRPCVVCCCAVLPFLYTRMSCRSESMCGASRHVPGRVRGGMSSCVDPTFVSRYVLEGHHSCLCCRSYVCDRRLRVRVCRPSYTAMRLCDTCHLETFVPPMAPLSRLHCYTSPASPCRCARESRCCPYGATGAGMTAFPDSHVRSFAMGVRFGATSPADATGVQQRLAHHPADAGTACRTKAWSVVMGALLLASLRLRTHS